MTIKKNLQNLSLKELRIFSGKTIAEVAEQANLSPKTYRTYERSPEKFTIEQAFKLCLLYGINIDEFMQLRSGSNENIKNQNPADSRNRVSI